VSSEVDELQLVLAAQKRRYGRIAKNQRSILSEQSTSAHYHWYSPSSTPATSPSNLPLSPATSPLISYCIGNTVVVEHVYRVYGIIFEIP